MDRASHVIEISFLSFFSFPDVIVFLYILFFSQYI
jgi:hypothetical protein